MGTQEKTAVWRLGLEPRFAPACLARGHALGSRLQKISIAKFRNRAGRLACGSASSDRIWRPAGRGEFLGMGKLVLRKAAVLLSGHPDENYFEPRFLGVSALDVRGRC